MNLSEKMLLIVIKSEKEINEEDEIKTPIIHREIKSFKQLFIKN